MLSLAVPAVAGAATHIVPRAMPDQSVWLGQDFAKNDKVTSFFGSAVAIRGNTALVASLPKAVFVLNKKDGVWTQTQELTGSGDYLQFGNSIALDGHTALIAEEYAEVDGNTKEGAAYIYTESDGTWSRAATLTPDDGQEGDQFGFAVALHGDNAVISNYNPFENRFIVYFFSRKNGQWQQTDEFIPPSCDQFGRICPEYGGFGYALAVGDGTAFVGADGAQVGDDDDYNGAVYVFTRGDDGKWTKTQKLTASDGEDGFDFGFSLALHGDTLLVGSPHDSLEGSAKPGSVYVFTQSGDQWKQTQEFSAKEGRPSDQFGDAIDFNSAGTAAVVGAKGARAYFYPGSAYLFKKGDDGQWRQAQAFPDSERGDLTGGNAYAAQGAVALDGNNIGIGAELDNGFYGVVHFYSRYQLGLSASAPEKVAPNEAYTSQAIVTNASSVTTPAVIATIPIPAAATFISASASQGKCKEGAGLVTCNFGPIGGNAGRATANVKIAPAASAGRGAILRNAVAIKSRPRLTASSPTRINRLPVASDGTLAAEVNQTAKGTLKANDPDGDPLVFQLVTKPKHGEVKITDAAKGAFSYTPAHNYIGADTFSFNADDGDGVSNTATVVVTVSNKLPVAEDGSLETKQDTAAKGTLHGSDAAGAPLTYKISALPSHGTVAIDNADAGTYTYTPDANYAGSDSFEFIVNDAHADSKPAKISITVTRAAPPPPPAPSGNGGGGAFGWPLLALLLGLALAAALGRRLHRGLLSKAATTRCASEEGIRIMKYRLLGILVATFGCVAMAGVGGVGTAFASPPKAEQAPSALHSGLTKSSLKTARRSGEQRHLVKMAPQSNLGLLGHATKVGPHAQKSRIDLIVALKLRNVSGLKKFLREVQNPRSPLYHHWLTPREFTARYAPSQADVARVTAFLKSRGIGVTKVSSNRLLIHTRATTNVYEHALGVRINDYRLNGRSFYSTTDSPKLPREIVPLVVNILGLNHGVQMKPLSRVKTLEAAAASPHDAPPASTAYFNPHQIAKAYDWPDITDESNGSNVRIAILTAMTPNADDPDYHQFWADFGLPDHTINVIRIGSGQGNGGAGETALDVEWAGAMAPGATLDVYVAADGKTDTFTEMYNQFVSDGKAQVMTTSWGLAESAVPDINRANEEVFMEAAAQGVSMFAASGDNGASDCAAYCPPGPNNADYPSSSEYITAANGTELSISDVGGTYGSEHAWNETGGAISQLFDKPDWQHGAGVPTNVDMRMNSDIAMNAGPLHPYIIYINGSSGNAYYGVYGTSAVAPILAAMFALGVSDQPDQIPLGQSNNLIYNDANEAGNYEADFRDVTTGCNGKLPDGSPSCAGKDWDHPTGWGSPQATSLLSHLGIQGPSGVLEGTVTDAASGATVAGAKLTANPGNFTRRTNSDGDYSFRLPVGDYTAEVTKFGYKIADAAVSIGDGDTVTQNFSLHKAPKVTLSGRVTDASGHGYGLYAEIKVDAKHYGEVADVWTDPATGSYQVKLPQGFDYTLHVASALDGYQPADAAVSLAGAMTKDFGLEITQACAAPGYYIAGLEEDFNGKWPPAGWSVINDYTDPIYGPSQVAWNHDEYFYNADNDTGGTGDAADVDSNFTYSLTGYYGHYDTSLATPPIPVSILPAQSAVKFKLNYQNKDGDALDLDMSTDGGASWRTLKHWDSSVGEFYGLPGADVDIDISSNLPSSGKVQFRWRYYDLTGGIGWDYYAQIDDVSIGGGCQPVAGGLVYGHATDANTGKGLEAKITSDTGAAVQSVKNPADSDRPLGTYILFVPTGTHTLTASYPDYDDAQADVTVANNAVLQQNFKLSTGKISVAPKHISANVMVNGQKTKTLTITNNGSAAARFQVLPINASVPVPATVNPHARAMRIKGHYSTAALPWIRAHESRADRQRAATSQLQAAVDSAWQDITALPVPIQDAAAVTDPKTGIVYLMNGINDSQTMLDTLYAYAPKGKTWSQLAHTPEPLEKPAAGFISGRIYVANGWNINGDPSRQLAIYDVGDDIWITGPKNPQPAGGGSASAVINGKLYLVGGCNDFSCGFPVSSVEAYDPATKTWSAVADYPHPVAWTACGNINDKLYCAGGAGEAALGTFYQDGYVYDPKHPEAGWKPIADIPTGTAGLWGGAYEASHGELLISGGVLAVQNNSAVTSMGFAYDPVNNKWTNLPLAKYATYRGASACGFYSIGGGAGFGAIVDTAEVLPGYGDCGKKPSIPYLTVTPASATVAPGASKKVTLTYDGAGMQAYSSSNGYLEIRSNTPDPAPIVTLATTWEAQPVHLVLTGEANPDSVQKGDDFAYTLTIANQKGSNRGDATQVVLTFAVPDGLSYRNASGDGDCSEAGGTVTCTFDTIGVGDKKTEDLLVTAKKAGRIVSTFQVSARQPDGDSSTNTLKLSTDVIGQSDLVLHAPASASVTEGADGTLQFEVANSGPDAAADVEVSATQNNLLSFRSVESSQGQCQVAERKLSCDLGEIGAGKSAAITLHVFGIHKGTGTMQVLATTASKDKNAKDVVNVKVRVTESSAPPHHGDSGGGAMGWLVLVMLAGLLLATGLVRDRKRAMSD
jgi:hypothetical protein